MSEWLKLNKSNCKNCYKCIRYCPVKSIRFSGNQARTIENECILCGNCYVVCPQGAKKISSELEKVRCFIQSNQRVVVSLAPSFVAYFEGASIGSMRESIKKLGFFDVEETAIGATIIKNEYIRILKEDKPDILISSCCHSVNLLIQKYFPKVLPCLSSTISPMQAHCIDIKKRMPLTKTVFIGPCLSKKDEADFYRGVVDAVLTFEELSDWLKSESIKLNLDSKHEKINHSKSRLFPTTGGILKTMEDFINSSKNNLKLESEKEFIDYSYIAIDGTQNCIETLKDIENDKIHRCFIEMSACTGGCVSGPVMKKLNSSSVRKFKSVYNYAGDKDFKVSQPSFFELRKTFVPIYQKNQQPDESDILAVLKNMGKINPEDELNCGSCGYDTCREKAIAVYHGKAEISMCLPFLKDKAENFSDNIVNNTPNGIIVVNEKLEVQLINNSARKMLNVRSASDVLGEPIVRIIDPTAFLSVLNNSKRIVAQRIYLAEYDRYFEQTIIPDKEYNVIICMLRDITDEENNKKKKEMISSQTIDVANKVVDKQMRIVQEIASLLGETAAETKIALTKLKETISNE